MNTPAPESRATAAPALVQRRRPGVVTFWLSFFATELRRLRRGMTRANLVDYGKTMMWVAPLTLLTWVWAEREQIETRSDVAVKITLHDEDPAHRSITLLTTGDEQPMVSVTLQGSQIALASAVRELQQINDDGLTVDIGPKELQPTDQSPYLVTTIPTLDKIVNNRRLAQIGVSITECRPTVLKVRVDRLGEEKDVPVVPPTDAPGLATATFSPQTVSVRGPLAALNDMKAAGTLKAVADIASLAVLGTPGEHADVSVAVLPPAKGMTVFPTTVKATLTVKQKDETGELATIPVLFGGPIGFQDTYRVSFDARMTNVKVQGPRELIQKLPQQKPPVAALLVFSADDLSATSKAKKPEFLNLPEGVRVVEPSASQTIPYSIKSVRE